MKIKVVKPCSVCNKCVINMSKHLLTHMRAAYQCDVCKKFFATKTNLNRHSAIHKINEKYICPRCNKYKKRCDKLKSHKCIE